MKIDVTKLAIVMDYLQRGGEVYYEGRTLVWLDEHTVREDATQRWVIDGLAIKTRKYEAGEDYEDPTKGEVFYMGHDMPVSALVQWTNNLSPIEFQRVARELTKLRSKE
ncbi:hypothetical protein CPT_Mater85 [Bacillus phage Mater]|uniref:Uncharacterized protein n=1 Tax=Bacillus phage Mater TaxID=1540090 RepID=A0A0A0RMP4_9CAUD|nr:hypothetical protein CPT_Mater85 [Bacillus phage Mater]AIW03242.1 hypothetical protein CPT_Mater85 [Bacillus phage Mater]